MSQRKELKKLKKRVYPKIETIREMMDLAVKEAPDHISHRYKEKDGSITSVTMRQFYRETDDLGTALVALGLSGAHVACCGENSYRWIRVFLTALMSDGVFVPLDKELPLDDLIYLLNDSGSSVLFCDGKYVDRFLSRREELPNLRYLISFDAEEHSASVLSCQRLIESGAAQPAELHERYRAMRTAPDELKYLVYTSGTTGIAKGVMLTEHNVVSGIYYGLAVSQIYGSCLSVLPYHHTYEAVCDILVSLHARTTLCINDSLRHVQDNLKLFQPDYVYLVPAFAEHFVKVIESTIDKTGKRKSFERGVKLTRALLKVGIDLRPVVFKQIRAAFGGNLYRIVCGGAPIRPEVSAFFGDIGIAMTGGYGITECSPLVSVNDTTGNNYRSAGHRLPCLQWRIDAPDADGIGEILVKGDVVMKGYYKRPDLTAEAIRDGWFYTGDYGYLTEDDEIVITGRKKNIIVLSNGKNIYPEEIENYILTVPYLLEAIVTPVKNEHGEDIGLQAEVYAGENGAEERDKTAVLTDIRTALATLPGYKQIMQLTIRKDPFPKTTSNKIKRTNTAQSA